VSDDESQAPSGLLNLAALGRRLRITLLVATGVGVLAAAVAAVIGSRPLAVGLGAFVAAVVIADLVLVAVSALGAADRAAKRGERLGGGDVGLLPPRRRR
jgi:hypothetical protein